MVRGGKRKGAGRKSIWKHSATQSIRVPKIFAAQLLEIARRLDDGEVLELVSSSKETNDEQLESVSSLNDQLTITGYIRQLELLGESIDVVAKKQENSNLQPHTAKALSLRLRVPDTTLRRYRQKMSSFDFAQWTSQIDPDHLGWEYDPEKKLYSHIYMEPVSGS
jgi:hypothetical protein